ncbi:MAG: tRNA(5-methylaminomethyl-2-thiouridylate) methyltransferase [Desulfonauticus sp.]|nr:tRNA(5-methylaminomethyl-2-thiouridylate) methyltransferase [Desulfonauticus sp.]
MSYHGLALFSGGLDSILAIRLLQEQGLKILGIHFISPFFGEVTKVPFWEKEYNLEVKPVDISESYLQLLLKGPEHGFGKVLNPCVDCKILMLKTVKSLLPKYGARFIVSGDVLGQRPMSQRKDALFLIAKKAEVSNILLRPLTALNLPPTDVERSGLVQREQLLALKGRGRKAQLQLAQKIGLDKIPSPAGGCLLTDKAMGARYAFLISRAEQISSRDFWLSRWGRQFWCKDKWLIIGRNYEENNKILALKSKDDVVLTIKSLPGPVALARKGITWEKNLLESAADFLLLFAPKVKQQPTQCFEVMAQSNKQKMLFKAELKDRSVFPWQEPIWDKRTCLIKSDRY